MLPIYQIFTVRSVASFAHQRTHALIVKVLHIEPGEMSRAEAYVGNCTIFTRDLVACAR